MGQGERPAGNAQAAPLAPDCSMSRLMRRSIDWMSPSMSSMACRGEFWRPGSHNLSIRDGMKNKDRVALGFGAPRTYDRA